MREGGEWIGLELYRLSSKMVEEITSCLRNGASGS